MATWTENPHTGEFIIGEAEEYRSRESVTVAVSQTLKAGHVIGRKATAATVAASAVTGTGNGVLTLAGTPYTSEVIAGNYRIVFIEPVTNLGTFHVEDPNGRIIGTGVVGTAFSKHIAFNIADGATDFVAGDNFTITVSAVSYQVSEWNPAATDGLQVPYGFLFAPVTTGGSATAAGVALVRACSVNASKLTWKSGVTTAQKNIAIQTLSAAAAIAVR